MIREQNNGLASELGGYMFKPRINKKSLELSATMKSLHKRLPEMLDKHEQLLTTRRKETAAQEVAECTFKPQRQGEKISAKYLQRMGRKKLTPDELIAYQQEKLRRIELRKQILVEVESKECTFRPSLSEKSTRIAEKLRQHGVLTVDPVTKTALTSPHKPNKYIAGATAVPELGNDGRYEEGPMLVIESEHPYRHNTNEFTTVAVPGAVQYTITFHEETRTEPVYDFVKFYDDETHTHYFGAGKYSGGINGSPCNWPGVGGRPPLVIPASRFIINFKTNGSVNDWGFRMHVIPLLMMNNNAPPAPSSTASTSSRPVVHHSNVGGNFEQISVHTPAIPNITDAARNLGPREPVHRRLYKHAVQKQHETQNQLVELYQTKLNISLKPWELSRSQGSGDGGEGAGASTTHSYVRMYSKTHLPKQTLDDIIEDMVVGDHLQANLQPQQSPVEHEEVGRSGASVRSQQSSVLRGQQARGRSALTVVEYDESLNMLWRQLRLL